MDNFERKLFLTYYFNLESFFLYERYSFDELMDEIAKEFKDIPELVTIREKESFIMPGISFLFKTGANLTNPKILAKISKPAPSAAFISGKYFGKVCSIVSIMFLLLIFY